MSGAAGGGSASLSLGGRAASLWTLLGVGLLFASAVFRLGLRGLTTIAGGLGPAEWILLALLTVTMVYSEGVMALQRRWVPRLIERARQLRAEPSLVLRLLAPLYGLSLVGAPGGRMLRAWGGTFAIVCAVLLVRALPEPWRGIVDFAVASALAWGLVSIVRCAPGAFREP
jgi:hypothetical protein